jgi:N-acetylneuraminate synthase/N,N'-diacetyllegionaminate synthase
LNLFGKDLERDVVVVAEIGINHEGDVQAAERLVDLAAESGVDAVKLQTYTPERYASASDPERLARVGRFSLDLAAHRQLAAHARERRIPLFSTALTEDVVPFLAEWCPAIKIASGDLNFEPVIRAACATGKPLILSTGNGTIEEIDQALVWCRDMVGEGVLPDRLVLMHCVSAYPTPIEQANVQSVPFLKQRYGLTVGYSNHVYETEAVLAAVALGAQVVEVHMTDKRSGREFRDHALSVEPAELAALVCSVRRVKDSLGRPGKAVQECERPLREIMRKGVVAARNLDAGTVLAQDDLMFARPAVHIPASEMPRLLGRTLVRAVRRGESILREDLR